MSSPRSPLSDKFDPFAVHPFTRYASPRPRSDTSDSASLPSAYPFTSSYASSGQPPRTPPKPPTSRQASGK
ncbi:uncharacterized protein SCHCODRAFT_02617924 [Schizophyllum commune H4-8]|nr:uncharacterized protein SCHCODRAFT_02617924 [Schizophyllum commune H4-8]KAI5894850.1 hypothetical protein SCHCODRAFT_02617924 [Schizophyllum commune H4-8]